MRYTSINKLKTKPNYGSMETKQSKVKSKRLSSILSKHDNNHHLFNSLVNLFVPPGDRWADMEETEVSAEVIEDAEVPVNGEDQENEERQSPNPVISEQIEVFDRAVQSKPGQLIANLIMEKHKNAHRQFMSRLYPTLLEVTPKLKYTLQSIAEEGEANYDCDDDDNDDLYEQVDFQPKEVNSDAETIDLKCKFMSIRLYGSLLTLLIFI